MLREDITDAASAIGRNIRTARLRRRWSEQELASRMAVSRQTVQRIEKGDEGVSLRVLGQALRALSLLDTLAGVGDPSADAAGLAAELGRAPHASRRKRNDARDDYDFPSS